MYTKRQIKTYINRYEHLKDAMLKLPPHEAEKHIYMENWVTVDDCGTARCAAGWAGSDRWFRKAGFTLEDSEGFLQPLFKGAKGYHAVTRFFGAENSKGASYYYHPVFGGEYEVYENYRPSREAVVEHIEAEINWLKGLEPVRPKRVRKPKEVEVALSE